MSEQARVAHSKDGLLSKDIEGFHLLAELALDMRSSWNHAADQLWLKLDPVLWDLTHNPWAVLQTVSREKLQRVLADPDFRKNVDDLVQARRDAAQEHAWFQQTTRNLRCAALRISVWNSC
jgi:glycogen phosphorylase